MALFNSATVSDLNEGDFAPQAGQSQTSVLKETLLPDPSRELSTSTQADMKAEPNLPPMERPVPTVEELLSQGRIKISERTPADQTAYETLLKDLRQSSSELRQRLLTLVASGIEINAASGICTGDDLLAASIPSNMQRSSSLNITTDLTLRTPWVGLARTFGSSLEIDPILRLADEKEAAEVFNCSLHTSMSEKGNYNILLYDHISDRALIDLQLESNMGATVLIPSQMHRVIKSSALASLDGAQSFLNAGLLALPADPNQTIHPNFVVDQNSEVSEKSLAILRDLVVNKGTMTFKVQGFDRETDLSPEITFDSERMALLGKRPLLFDGQLEYLAIERVAETKKELRLRNLPSPGKDGVARGEFGESWSVEPDYEIEGNPAQKIYIAFPPPLLNEPGEHPVYVPVDLDLRPLGGKVIQDFIYQRALPPVLEQDGYKFYSNTSLELLLSSRPEALPAVTAGIGHLMQKAGLTDLQPLKKVLIIQASEDNAFFSPAVPDAITIYDEIVNGCTPQQISETARHEAAHLIDVRFGLSRGVFQTTYQNLIEEHESAIMEILDAASKMTEMITSGNPGYNEDPEYQRLQSILDRPPPTFLIDICEGQFLPGGFGGHAYDNEKELLASVITSLEHPYWEQAVAVRSPEFRSDYLRVLTALEANVSKTREIPENSELQRDLQRKIGFLQSDIGIAAR